MRKETGWTIFILVFLIIVLSVVDILANFIGAIPILGDIAETLSETVLESIQVLLTSIIGIIAVRRR
jgi:hypothetical protein